MKINAWTAILLGGLVFSSSVAASGSIGGRGGGFSDRAPRQVDPLYELGKAVVKGKVADYGKIKYCVTAPDSESGAKLRGKTAKQYRSSTYERVALALYNCELPEQRMVDVLSEQDLVAVVHYLNVRYKLGLTA